MSYTMNYSLRIVSLSGLLLFAFSYAFGLVLWHIGWGSTLAFGNAGVCVRLRGTLGGVS